MNQSVERGLAILDQLALGEARLGELAEMLGTHKSTVLRILQTMEARGFVRRTEQGTYLLGTRVMELGAAALEGLDLSGAARPGLEKIAAATGETVHLAILDRGHVVYVGKVESIHPVRMYSRVGATAPVHCTGVGKVLLAYTPPDEWPDLELERFTDHTIVDLDHLREEAAGIRARGWGVDEREHQDSIRCIAAPVFDDRGGVAAALSVTALDSRMSREVLNGYVPQLLDASRMITRALGGDPGLVATEEVATSTR